MKCIVGEQVETEPGKAAGPQERDGRCRGGKGVPAQVCPNCGEECVVL